MRSSTVSSLLVLLLTRGISCDWMRGHDTGVVFLHLDGGMRQAETKTYSVQTHEQCMDQCAASDCIGYSVAANKTCTLIDCQEFQQSGIQVIEALKLPKKFDVIIDLPRGEDLAKATEAAQEVCAAVTPAVDTTTTAAPAMSVLKKPEELRPFSRTQYKSGVQFFRELSEPEVKPSERLGSSKVMGKIIPYSSKDMLTDICSDTQCIASLGRKRIDGYIFKLVKDDVNAEQGDVAGVQTILGYVATRANCCGATEGINEHSQLWKDGKRNFDYNASASTNSQWETTEGVFFIWP